MGFLKILGIVSTIAGIGSEIGKSHIAKKQMEQAVKDIHNDEIEKMVEKKMAEFMSKMLTDGKS